MAILRWRPAGQAVDRWDPFREIADIQHEMNRVFDSYFGRSGALAAPDRLWAPAMDMWETKDELMVALDLPGVSEKDVHVSITGELLSVRGERPQPETEVKPEGFYRSERWSGKFERSVNLPFPVQADRVSAVYRDGTLTIRLPKADEVKPKEIKISVQ
jgi:HSP20 family protein